jgi:hypothetical protein
MPPLPCRSFSRGNAMYADRSDATVYEQHQDLIRMGAQAGFTLVSTNPRFPFGFTLPIPA